MITPRGRARFRPIARRACALLCAAASLLLPACYDMSKSSFMDAGPDAGEPVDDGELVWAKQIVSSGNIEAKEVDVFPNGQLVVAGQFTLSATFGPGESNQKTLDAEEGILEWYDIFIANLRQSDGVLEWAVHSGGARNDILGDMVALDDLTTRVVGSFDQQTVFDTGGPEETHLTGPGEEMFIASYGAEGSMEWAVQAGGAGYDSASALCEAPEGDGSILVTGGFSTVAEFDYDVGDVRLTTEADCSLVATAAFVSKFDDSGNAQWAIGTTGCASGNDIDSFASGFAVTGAFEGATTFGSLDGEHETLETAGTWESDVFVARFDPDGELDWAVQAGGGGVDSGSSVRALDDGSVVVVGVFESTASFGEGAQSCTLWSSGGKDVFIAYYLHDGTLAWVRQVGGPGHDLASDVDVVADGSIVVAGRFTESAVFGPGELGETTLDAAGGHDAFIAMLDTGGDLVWARHEARDESHDAATDLAVSQAGSSDILLATGWFQNSAVFGSGEEGEADLENDDGTSAFAIRVDL